jgi:DNA-binding MurR/RpiR family transcriptional regulator
MSTTKTKRTISMTKDEKQQLATKSDMSAIVPTNPTTVIYASVAVIVIFFALIMYRYHQ